MTLLTVMAVLANVAWANGDKMAEQYTAIQSKCEKRSVDQFETCRAEAGDDEEKLAVCQATTEHKLQCCHANAMTTVYKADPVKECGGV